MRVNYGEAGNLVYGVCMDANLDIQVLENMLDGQNATFVTSEDEEYESLLANLYEELSDRYYDDEARCGAILLDITKCFLKHGFDAEKYGCECLHALCWANAGAYTLDIAELLLDNGASLYFSGESEDVAGDEDEDNGVLDSIAWTLGRWHTNAWENANLMTAYYIMAEYAKEGKDYHGIRAAETCIGLPVDRVEKVTVNTCNKDFNEHKNRDYKDGLILWCGGHPLVLREYVELFVNPRILDDCVSVYDVSDQYADIIGARINQIKYIGADYALIGFEKKSEKLLVARIMYSEDSDRVSHGVAEIVKSIEFDKESFSDIENVYLVSGMVYSSEVRVYEENAVILKEKDRTVLIYSEELEDDNYILKGLDIGDNITRGKYREMQCSDITLNQILTTNEYGVVELEFHCDKGFLYFKADSYRDVDIMLSPKQLQSNIIAYTFDKEYIGLQFIPVRL